MIQRSSWNALKHNKNAPYHQNTWQIILQYHTSYLNYNLPTIWFRFFTLTRFLTPMLEDELSENSSSLASPFIISIPESSEGMYWYWYVSWNKYIMCINTRLRICHSDKMIYSHDKMYYYETEDMHFVWFYPCEMDFSHHESQNFIRVAKQWGWDSETSGEISISRGKLYKMHFLAYFTLQSTVIMLNTLHKVEYHENHVRWIYLTTVLYMGESQKYARTLSDNVYLLYLPMWSPHYITRDISSHDHEYIYVPSIYGIYRSCSTTYYRYYGIYQPALPHVTRSYGIFTTCPPRYNQHKWYNC